jgi:hypothetical protein
MLIHDDDLQPCSCRYAHLRGWLGPVDLRSLRLWTPRAVCFLAQSGLRHASCPTMPLMRSLQPSSLGKISWQQNSSHGHRSYCGCGLGCTDDIGTERAVAALRHRPCQLPPDATSIPPPGSAVAPRDITADPCPCLQQFRCSGSPPAAHARRPWSQQQGTRQPASGKDPKRERIITMVWALVGFGRRQRRAAWGGRKFDAAFKLFSTVVGFGLGWSWDVDFDGDKILCAFFWLHNGLGSHWGRFFWWTKHNSVRWIIVEIRNGLGS